MIKCPRINTKRGKDFEIDTMKYKRKEENLKKNNLPGKKYALIIQCISLQTALESIDRKKYHRLRYLHIDKAKYIKIYSIAGTMHTLA